MIRLRQLTLTRGSKPLLEGADLTLNPGRGGGVDQRQRQRQVQPVRAVARRAAPGCCALDLPPGWRIAHVAQETPALQRSALDYAIDGGTTLRRLHAELARAEAAHDGHAIAELHAALADADAYTVRTRAEQLLGGLVLSHAQMNEPVARFSGGWRMRLNLA